jgi:hypothetical protein
LGVVVQGSVVAGGLRTATVTVTQSADGRVLSQRALGVAELDRLRRGASVAVPVTLAAGVGAAHAELSFDMDGCQGTARSGDVQPVPPRGHINVSAVARYDEEDSGTADLRIGAAGAPCNLIDGSALRIVVGGLGRTHGQRTLRLSAACGTWGSVRPRRCAAWTWSPSAATA